MLIYGSPHLLAPDACQGYVLHSASAWPDGCQNVLLTDTLCRRNGLLLVSTHLRLPRFGGQGTRDSKFVSIPLKDTRLVSRPLIELMPKLDRTKIDDSGISDNEVAPNVVDSSWSKGVEM